MARHVSEGPILLQGLVGVSMSGVMAKPLEDLIQAPGTPSLFWALANRPRPFIDLTAVHGGRALSAGARNPSAPRAGSVPWSLEKARIFSEELRIQAIQARRLYAAFALRHRHPALFQEWTSKLGLAALVAQAYPEAKRALIAQGRVGMRKSRPCRPSRSTALHTYQVVSAVARRCLQMGRHAPYYAVVQGERGVDRPREFSGRANLATEAVHACCCPRSGRSQMAQLRVDRQLDAIQCIEAIRIYGAAHGRLPASLEDITEAPVADSTWPPASRLTIASREITPSSRHLRLPVGRISLNTRSSTTQWSADLPNRDPV